MGRLVFDEGSKGRFRENESLGEKNHVEEKYHKFSFVR